MRHPRRLSVLVYCTGINVINQSGRIIPSVVVIITRSGGKKSTLHNLPVLTEKKK